MPLPGRMLLAASSLEAGNGGIARVARLMARAMVEELGPGSPRGLTLWDRAATREFGFPTATARGSKLRFAFQLNRAAWSCSSLVFDAVHLAQTPRVGRRPYLTFLHGVEIWDQAKPSYLRGGRKATILLANSQFTKDRANELHGGFDHAQVCWLATEPGDKPAAPEKTGRRPEVLVVARMDEEYKGHRELIECWPQVVTAVPAALLRFVGRGQFRAKFEELARASPAADQIRFEGFVTEERLEQLYNEAAVFSMPSRGEGFGLVYIEAMRHGLPVVASRHDAAPEIVAEGETGYLADLDRPGDLADRIVDLLRNPDRAARLGDAGRRRWSELFCYEAFKSRFRPFLQQLASSEA